MDADAAPRSGPAALAAYSVCALVSLFFLYPYWWMLLGAFRSVRGGHKLNHAVMSALMADHSAWTMVDAEAMRPLRGHADLAAGLAAPAYAPDVS